MPSRRGAQRSHAGCAECKTRHVKCDEVFPECGRCRRNNRSCSLSQHDWMYGRYNTVTAPTVQDHRDFNFPLEVQPPLGIRTGLSQAEQDLFDEYLETTSKTLNERDDIKLLFRVTAPELARSRPYLMYCMLAIASQHRLLRYSASVGDHSTADIAATRVLSLELQSRAISLYVDNMNKSITVDDCVAACLGCVFMLLCTMASFQRDYSQSFSGLAKAIEVLRLQAGISVVWKSSRTMIKSSDLGPIWLLYADGSHSGAIQEEVGEALDRLDSLFQTRVLPSKLQNTCNTALGGLRNTYRAINQCPSDVANRLGWVRADDASNFADMVEAKQPEALLLLAYWAALLNPWPGAWWEMGLGSAIMDDIRNILPAAFHIYLPKPQLPT